MNVGADAMIGLQNGLVGIADALMNLVALARLALELESDLLGGLLRGHGCMDRQQAKAWQAGDRTLNAVGIADGLSQHLIAATDADNRFSVAVGSLDGLRTTVTAQLQKVVERGLRARQNDDVSPLQVSHIIRIEEIHARVSL